MTRTLLIMRHGKSDHDAAHEGDHERPLKKRGVKAARRMGRLLAERELVPRLVLASSALRARTTADLAVQAGGFASPARIEPDLYQAAPAEIVQILRRLPEQSDPVLVVGHEPGCSETIALLGGGSAPTFPTAALACLELDVATWDALQPGSGRLLWLVTPRELG